MFPKAIKDITFYLIKHLYIFISVIYSVEIVQLFLPSAVPYAISSSDNGFEIRRSDVSSQSISRWKSLTDLLYLHHGWSRSLSSGTPENWFISNNSFCWFHPIRIITMNWSNALKTFERNAKRSTSKFWRRRRRRPRFNEISVYLLTDSPASMNRLLEKYKYDTSLWILYFEFP